MQIAGAHLYGAGLVGFAISAVWWSNSHAAKLDAPYAPVAYGLGAALGTVSGMALTTWWYTGWPVLARNAAQDGGEIVKDGTFWALSEWYRGRRPKAKKDDEEDATVEADRD